MPYILFIFLLVSFSTAYAADDINRDLPRSRDLDIDIPSIQDSLRHKKLEPLKPLAPRPEAKDDPNAQTFFLREIIIEGATLYKEKDLRPVYRFFLNKEISFNDIDKIVRRIERFYSQHGWLAARVIVPKQEIRYGLLRLKVFEGHIVNIIIEGDAGISTRLIKDALESLKTGKPARLADLKEHLTRLLNFPHLQLQPSIEASEKQVGGVDLRVKVIEHRIFTGNIEVNNFANDILGVWQLANFNIWNFAETRLFTYVSITPWNLDYAVLGSLRYEHQFNFDGLKMGMSLGGLRTRPEGQQIDFKGFNFNVYLYQPLYRSDVFQLAQQFDYNNNFNRAIRDKNLYTDSELYILSFTLSGSYRNPWHGSTNFSIKTRQGLAEGKGPDLGNAAGGAQFKRRATWFTATLNQQQTLILQKENQASSTLLLSLEGQYALDPLVSSERIGFGKRSFGRAFAAGHIAGDHGIGGTLEFSTAWPPLGLLNDKSIVQGLTLYQFFDYARSFNITRPSDASGIRHRHLFSVGLGLRFKLFNMFLADISWAHALNDPYASCRTSNVMVTPSGIRLITASDTPICTNLAGKNNLLVKLYHFF